MKKNKMLRRIAFLISLIMLFTSTVNATYGLIVTKTDSLVNVFTPFESVISQLLISKKVEHPFGEDYSIPEDIAFDFDINFGPLYARTTMKTTAGNIPADENGAIQVSIRPGKTFAVEGVDAGTKVTVTELQKTDSGFTVKDGAAVMEGIVAEDGSLEFRYINVYSPTAVSPTNLSLTGKKVIRGRDWQAGDSFSFLLEQKLSDGTWKALDTAEVTYDPEDPDFQLFDLSSAIRGLSFERVGVYQFRITEKPGEIKDITYDNTVNTFSIRVTDVDMDGKLEINAVTATENARVREDAGEFAVSVVFSNTFVPHIPDPEDITLEIGVDKTVVNTGEASIGPEDFVFRLEAADGSKLTQVTDTAGKATFRLPLTAKDAGKTYTYKLYEVDDGKHGVTYDTKVYDIVVAVTVNSKNELVAAVTLDGQKVDKAVAAFRNTYHFQHPKPEDITVEIGVDKTVQNTGVASIGPEGFQFLLEAADGSKLTQVTDTAGKATFRLPFTATDIGRTFTYRLYERNDGDYGVTYDTSVHEITVAIALSGENRLVATVTVDGQQVEQARIAFENIYHFQQPKPDDIAVEIAVDKTVVNSGVGDMGPEGFQFLLEAADGSKLTQTTDEAGKATFRLPFTATDIGKTCTYQLYEVNGGVAGVTYDTKVYDIAIAIALSGENKLVATATVDGQQVEQVLAAFENRYHEEPPRPEDIAVEIGVDKTVKNTGTIRISPEGFRFVLQNTADGSKRTVTSDAAGKATFRLPFTADDVGKTYSYQLFESNGGITGMTYDTKVYDITVAVALSGENKLVATVTVDGQQVEKARVAFENIYHVEIPRPDDITVVVDIIKTVKNTGRDTAGPGSFEFVLEDAAGNKQLRYSNEHGKTAFDLTYTADDIGRTFTYKLSETDKGKSGMTYDPKVYEIVIAVALEQNGKLEAAVSVNGHAVKTPIIEFVNIYHADPPNTPPTGDTSNIVFWFVMMLLSGAACVGLIIAERKHRKKEKS